MDTTVGEIADLIGGTVIGDVSRAIRGLNGIDKAEDGELSFLDHPKYHSLLSTTRASAVLVPYEIQDAPTTLIQVGAPRHAFAQLLERYSQTSLRPPQGIHPLAIIGERVSLGKNVNIDAFVRVADDAVLGDGVTIYAGGYVGQGTAIGPNTILFPNVTIYHGIHIGARCILHSGAVLGSDGFGFIQVNGHQTKVPQVGTIILGDDVEVGANSCIDRATFGATTIGQGTKIDNLVQIGHNVQIGDHCVVSGMSGLAGSTVMGNRVTVGANAGFAGHLHVGDDVVVCARAGVTKSIPAGKVVSGFPAIDHHTMQRIRASARRLPDALRQLNELEQRLIELERRLDGKAEDNP